MSRIAHRTHADRDNPPLAASTAARSRALTFTVNDTVFAVGPNRGLPPDTTET